MEGRSNAESSYREQWKFSKCRGLILYYDYLLFVTDTSIDDLLRILSTVFSNVYIDVHVMISSNSKKCNRRARLIYRNKGLFCLFWVDVRLASSHSRIKERRSNCWGEKSDAYQTPVVCIHVECHIQNPHLPWPRPYPIHIHTRFPYFLYFMLISTSIFITHFRSP